MLIFGLHSTDDDDDDDYDDDNDNESFSITFMFSLHKMTRLCTFTPPPLPQMTKLELGSSKNFGFQIYIRLGSTKAHFCSVSYSPPGNAAHL